MINAIIIDNELTARNSLRRKLTKNCPQINIIGEADGVNTGIILIKKVNPELIFLDIQMQDGTGFDLIDKLLNDGPVNSRVIFVTAYDQYAIKAIKYSALDYLLKPCNDEELTEAVKKVTLPIVENQSANYNLLLNNAVSNAQLNTLKKIIINTSKSILFLKLTDIIYCESNGNYTILHLAGNKSITATKMLKEYEGLLKDDGFFRVHNSYIVNIINIESYNKQEDSVQMSDGSAIPVARGKKEELIEMFNK